MKVGIITIFSDNYGNKLQNFAVQKLLTTYIDNAETIKINVKNGIKFNSKKTIYKKISPRYILKVVKSRFKNKYIYKNQRDGIIQSIKLSKRNSFSKLINERTKHFNAFTKKHLNISNNTISLTNLDDEWINEYDYFVSGSDQVWNPTYLETSSINFLQFVPKEKRIALAPSIGLSKIPELVKPLYKKWISEIPYLSVREEKGAEIIKELTGRDAIVLADPTLCVSRDEWIDIEEKPNFDLNESYVFTYFLGNETNKYRKYIERYAKENDCQIININDLREPEHYVVNPSEFIYLIHNAKVVFTDSFHACVFSIIMNTPFIVFDRIEVGGTGMSSRIDTLLKTFSLENRKFPLPIEKINKVDYSNNEIIINKLVEKTNLFLSSVFNNKNKTTNEEIKLKHVLDKKQDCSGCTACVNICPKKCIEMKDDEEGFLYPVIEENKCIHCNLCKNICPINNNISNNNPKAYVGYINSEDIRKNSSSGGIFTAIAEKIIERGGIVYGAAFDEYFEVHHIDVNNIKDLEKMRTSKYVQSNLKDSFPKIKEQLNCNELVYFTGTPCQVEGLLHYLGKKYENLYTQDIVCHGVPSPRVWKTYLNSIKGKKKLVSFRDKKYGWHYFSMRINTNKKRYVKRLDEDTYTRLFLDNIILRPSCYDCHFKKEVRLSDFTLADCWNLDKIKTKIRDNDKGLSMIFVNSEKGQKLFKQINDKLTIDEIDYKTAIKTQSAATESVKKTEQRTVFFESANIHSYDFTIKNWYNKSIIAITKKKLIYIKTKLRKMIKK